MRPGEVLVLCSGNSASSTRAVCRQCETRCPTCAQSWHYLAILRSSHALLIRRYWKWLSWVRFTNWIPQNTGLFNGSKHAGLRLWNWCPMLTVEPPALWHLILKSLAALDAARHAINTFWCGVAQVLVCTWACSLCWLASCSCPLLAASSWVSSPKPASLTTPGKLIEPLFLMIIGRQLDGQQMS